MNLLGAQDGSLGGGGKCPFLAKSLVHSYYITLHYKVNL